MKQISLIILFILAALNLLNADEFDEIFTDLSSQIPEYENRCNSGDLRACYDMARLYLYAKRDNDKFESLMDDLCNNKKLGDACEILGIYYEPNEIKNYFDENGNSLNNKYMKMADDLYKKAKQYGFKYTENQNSKQNQKETEIERFAYSFCGGAIKMTDDWDYALTDTEMCIGEFENIEASIYTNELKKLLEKNDYNFFKDQAVKACKSNLSFGCYYIGIAYKDGLYDTPKDITKAVKIFERGCIPFIDNYAQYVVNLSKDFYEPCYEMGIAYRDGIGVEKDSNKSTLAFEKACDSKFFPDACAISAQNESEISKKFEYMKKACEADKTFCDKFDEFKINSEKEIAAKLDESVENKNSIFPNLVCDSGMAIGCYASAKMGSYNAEKYWQKACRLDKKYCDEYGKIAMKNLNIKNAKSLATNKHKELFEYAKQACDDGLAYGCWMVGTTEAISEAAGTTSEQWVQKACDADPRYCGLSDIYTNQIIVAARTGGDFAAVAEEVCKKFDYDMAEICQVAGVGYLRGIGGLPQDLALAFERISHACDQGAGSACNTKGEMQISGKAVSKDIDGGVASYKSGCTYNDAQSCYLLGLMYYHGDNVEKNQKSAKNYFRSACGLGHQESCGIEKSIK